MIINGQTLLAAAPIKNMLDSKKRENNVSYGLVEVGYDIRIKQDVSFIPNGHPHGGDLVTLNEGTGIGFAMNKGRFTLASSVEEFDMPDHLMAIVHDKSTWARHGLSVFNTVIEPGWKGFLTLELVYHGQKPLTIPAGSGIAQVIFHEPLHEGKYVGAYQNQEDRPVSAANAVAA